jgi:hypothetical protein
LDGLQRFFVSGSNPVPLQLFFVKFHPLDEEAQGPSRERSPKQPRVDLHEDLLLLIPGVEVRRLVVLVVHVHGDSVETAEDRHLPLLNPAFSFDDWIES